MSLREHMRCLLCGRWALLQVMGLVPDIVHPRHEIECATQEVGGNKNIRWTRRPPTEDELTMLTDVIEAVLERVHDAVDGQRSDLAEIDDATEFHERAAQYVAVAQRELEQANAELHKRLKKVTELAQRWTGAA